jgi:pimeloyl-ACP methyl ester carboxylesterase
VNVREIGSFYMGGRVVEVRGLDPLEVRFTSGLPPRTVEQNGRFDAFQMYVHYVKLAASEAGPLLLWHGGSMTGAVWERTPDDRPGWQTAFLEAGYDVYVSDAVERGRSSWNRHPEIYASAPVYRSKAEAWNIFRIGPAEAAAEANAGGVWQAHPGVQFPTEAFDQFTKSLVPRWLSNDAATQAAYDELVRRTGPCTIVAHSQGAAFALQAALNSPQSVRALVAIEPTGTPHPTGQELAALRDVPHLLLWGDFIEGEPFWRAAFENAERYASALRSAGVECERVVLPRNGIYGNSHLPMLDRNSERIAQIVARWLEQRAGSAPEPHFERRNEVVS